MSFQDAVELLAKRHVPLSRSAWHKLRDPKYLIKNFNVLAGFADIFGANGDYLINENAATPRPSWPSVRAWHRLGRLPS